MVPVPNDSTTTRSRAGVRAALAVTVVVLIAGNALALIRDAWLSDVDARAVAANGALALVTLAVAGRLGVGWGEVGLRAGRWRVVLGGVVAASALGAVGGALVLAAPVVTGEEVRYAGTDVAGDDLARQVLLYFPVATALPEELIFRGALHGLWARATSTARAVVVTSAAFACWHFAVLGDAIAQSGVAEHPALFALAYLGCLAALFVAGVVFAWLRVASGGVAAPVLAHWLAVATLRGVMWAGA